ncbi:MAG TPA: hypothetical protein VIL36_06985 [Acidimicrobiales bacterium]
MLPESDGALAWAEGQVAAVRDDPAARLALLDRTYRSVRDAVGVDGDGPGPGGDLGGRRNGRNGRNGSDGRDVREGRVHGPRARHRPFRRAALSFMRWQLQRGVLAPPDASPPGSVWWRAVNERLLRDGCEAVALAAGHRGTPSSPAVALWLDFLAAPSARRWYRAHNASVVGGYLDHREPAEAETPAERFFMNVALVRVLYTHAAVAAPRLALGRLGPLGPVLGDPRRGTAGAFLSLRRVVPDTYPLALDVGGYVADQRHLGRLLDCAVIAPRLPRLFAWSAQDLGEPGLLGLLRDGRPVYAGHDDRHVWHPPALPLAGRLLRRATRPR